MMQYKKLIKIGDSVGITLPYQFIKQVEWKIGDEVILEADVSTEVVIIRKAKQGRKPLISLELIVTAGKLMDRYKGSFQKAG